MTFLAMYCAHKIRERASIILLDYENLKGWEGTFIPILVYYLNENLKSLLSLCI